MNFENEVVKHIESDEIEYIQFKRLLNHHNIKHAYILKTHNMNFRIGKNFRLIEQLKSNLKVVSQNLGFEYSTFIRPDYNHSNNVAVIDFVNSINGEPDLKGERFCNTDALITKEKGITLMSTNADCCLVLLYDPVKNIIANVHAGWRGTFDKIVLNVVEKMKQEFNCVPENIEAYFCPSIRQCHFEVDEDVKNICEEKFAYTNQLNRIIKNGEIKEGKQKYLIDNLLINKILLLQEGLKDTNIIDSGICSVCSSEKIHSRRVEGEFFGLRSLFYRVNLVIS